MSHLSSKDILELQEAYRLVYSQEEIREETQDLQELLPLALGAGAAYLGSKAVKGFVSGLRGDSQKPATTQNKSKFAGARDAAFKKAQAIKGSPVVGPTKPTAKPTATPSSKPTASKPAPSSVAKPAPSSATKPTSTPAAKPTSTAASSTPAAKPSAMDTWAKANPRLAQAQKIRQQGGSRAEVNKDLYNKGTAAAEKTPTVVKAGFDLFDVIKGYLLDEGYADTEEAALAIMANMSDEWVGSIVEMSDFEAGGGNAKIKKTGMNKASVEALGKKNLANLAKKQTPQQSQKSSQVPAVKSQRQFTPPKSKTISGVGKPAAARASEIGSVTAADKFHAYNDSQNRADDVASWMGVNRKDPRVKKFADTNYRQNIALKTNDPKYDPTKTSYPEFTPAKKSSQSTWDTLGGKRG